ncbi:hypothetical protein QEZ54_08785 [Catellatospora sp. KI3]|uniref:hypothetical protein n=1 Tax=Catellatospora sp. KI3 TaxID=3041620 RepID=UPI002482D348|nr:hypothetical protein [Catellatospora sp. KI3]MDI1461057.1 hypothetical protein [Catellatospora sp. KI3]
MYGFVHRAFLEYLTAGDLARRLTDFDLTHEQVLAVYEQRWQDPAWAEVLLLLTGIIPDKVAAQAITRLLTADPHWRLRPQVPRHLLLALQVSTEIRKTAILAPHAPALTRALTTLLEETVTRERRYDRPLPDAVDRLTPHLARLRPDLARRRPLPALVPALHPQAHRHPYAHRSQNSRNPSRHTQSPPPRHPPPRCHKSPLGYPSSRGGGDRGWLGRGPGHSAVAARPRHHRRRRGRAAGGGEGERAISFVTGLMWVWCWGTPQHHIAHQQQAASR